MAATKRQMNVTSCTFTPTSGSSTTYTGVTSVATDHGGSLIKFSGDGDRYPTTTVNDFNDPEQLNKTSFLLKLLGEKTN